jgi:hypothetical protein
MLVSASAAAPSNQAAERVSIFGFVFFMVWNERPEPAAFQAGVFRKSHGRFALDRFRDTTA